MSTGRSKSIRIYELARELEVQSKEVLEVLQEEMNIDVSNHMSTVNPQVADRVRTIIVGGEDEAEEESAAPEPEPASEPQAEEEAPAETVPAASRAEPAQAPPDDDDDPAEERDGQESAQPRQPATRRQITLTGPLTIGELAARLGINPTQAVRSLVQRGIMAGINESIDVDSARRLAEAFGAEVVIEEETSDEDFWVEFDDGDDAAAAPRPPVVTVLGHVDHGKTTLLDTIRETRVTEQEAGGITQHIGASSIETDGRTIVFLDTPGHEAFTAMRARGAQVTDICVVVIAADDGVMPQTVEAINHAKAAEVPIIVAINKVDLPNADPDRVRQQLTEHGLVPEEWGGDTICVELSALIGDNIDELLEMIGLVAEIEELKAVPDGPARGTVIEAELDKGRGPVATVLVQEGVLRQGDPLIAGMYSGRVRAMTDDRGERVKEAGPSTAVEVMGLSDVPLPGDPFQVTPDESEARSLADDRQDSARAQEIQASQTVSLEDFQRRMEAGEANELPLVIKGDVQGSVEALRQSLERINQEEVGINVIHTGVGAVTESDVMLAAASGAIILGFNVRPNTGARRAAESEGVEIRTYRVIYEAIDDVRSAMEGMMAPEIREQVVGHAEVRATFNVPGAGTVAGCFVTEGVVRRDGYVRVVRDGVVIYEGEIASLRRFEDDVREVAQGYECGILIDGYNDVREDDRLEIYVEQEIQRTLQD